jgi:hypothetical protein
MFDAMDDDDPDCEHCHPEPVDWVVMGRRPDSPVDEHGYCKRCGGGLVLNLPLTVDKVVDAIEQFCAMHKDCVVLPEATHEA